MEKVTTKKLALYSGRTHRALAEEVAGHLGQPLGEANIVEFANGEIRPRFAESVRGSDVFIMQTHYGVDGRSINDSIIEQLTMIDAAYRASAKRITAVCPCYGYARQDRKAEGREPITARLIADMFKAAGAKRMISIDLHSGQIQGFFDGPVDHLTAAPVLEDYVRRQAPDSPVIVSPDSGRIKVAERMTQHLNDCDADLAFIYKRRPKGMTNVVEAKEVIGDVKGRLCILTDDMIDTGGTIVSAAEILMQRGATEVWAMATHGVLSGNAVDRLKNSQVSRIVLTNTLPLPPEKQIPQIEVLSVAGIIAEALSAVFDDTSVSEIFGGENLAEGLGHDGEHFDVVVIGAGISGLGAAYHLQEHCPDRSFVIIEGRDDIGGTWDLFRYPGVRSDSDMHTLGFSFKPWNHEKAIADGPSIMAYLRETVAEHGIERHIRFGHHADSASWSSDTARWTLRTHRTGSGEPVEFTCNFLYMCSGYYSYKGGYPAVIPGIERFEGHVVHPQKWPEQLDYHDKRVVVIGSGATAVTLVPAMAPDVEHITMLQRSPSYVLNLPSVDEFSEQLKSVTNEATAYKLVRRRNTAMAQVLWDRSCTTPDLIRELLLSDVRNALGDELTDAHFTPRYQPWDQRICVVPNGDLYAAIKSGKASVVTDTIDTVTEHGIRLSSGAALEADIIITATGLQLVTVGEMDIDIDGEAVDFGDRFTYKGIAYSDVPNMASAFGYIHASWTLRSDLIALYVCRLLNHMRETATDQCTPRLRSDELDMPRRPWIEGFSAGYIQRMLPLLPKQGDRAPWLIRMDYRTDRRALRDDPVDDGVMQFGRAASRAPV